MAGQKYPVLIADDHQLILTGLRIVIGESDSFYVCHEGRNGDDVLAGFREKTPRIAVLDIGMPPGTELEDAAERSLVEEMERLGIREISQYGGLVVVSHLKKAYLIARLGHVDCCPKEVQAQLKAKEGGQSEE